MAKVKFRGWIDSGRQHGREVALSVASWTDFAPAAAARREPRPPPHEHAGMAWLKGSQAACHVRGGEPHRGQRGTLCSETHAGVKMECAYINLAGRELKSESAESLTHLRPTPADTDPPTHAAGLSLRVSPLGLGLGPGGWKQLVWTRHRHRPSHTVAMRPVNTAETRSRHCESQPPSAFRIFPSQAKHIANSTAVPSYHPVAACFGRKPLRHPPLSIPSPHIPLPNLTLLLSARCTRQVPT
jgi:hypothetical protein